MQDLDLHFKVIFDKENISAKFEDVDCIEHGETLLLDMAQDSMRVNQTRHSPDDLE